MRRTLPALAAVIACLIVPSGAAAYPNSPRDAIVSLGDSYISGEAGRWYGNSIDNTGDRSGTDRATLCSLPLVCDTDIGRVYVHGTDANGCHRSDVAEILAADVPTDLKVNLACSGAETANVFRGASGGVAFKGEAPQADQLDFIAKARRVKLIVLSIGGNDLGFASIVQDCITAYLSFSPPCQTTHDHPFNLDFVSVLGRVDKAIKDIRVVMNANGYRGTPYRFVLQSYPAALPRASENRYAERDPLRSAGGGCPFYDSDSDWARDHIGPRISRGLGAVARANDVQFLDLSNAFQGREFCSESSSLVGPSGTPGPPSSTTHEWTRFVNQGSLTQGEVQELFHPNAFGQQALARCLTLIWQETGPAYACTNQAGQGAGAMQLSPSG
jgi:lysophospholipase L1-like esterase